MFNHYPKFHVTTRYHHHHHSYRRDGKKSYRHLSRETISKSKSCNRSHGLIGFDSRGEGQAEISMGSFKEKPDGGIEGERGSSDLWRSRKGRQRNEKLTASRSAVVHPR